MNRIDAKFKELRDKNQKALVAFISAGDPDFDTSLEIITRMCKSGVDVLELGVGFSDPTADGPVIQRASQRAIKAGMSLRRSLEMVKLLRQRVDTPIVIFSYYNPVFNYGVEKFCRDAAAAGVDGALLVDLAYEESAEFTQARGELDMKLIRLVAPTTSNSRAAKICSGAEGFVYLISRTGVTGTGGLDYSEVESHVREVKAMTKMPVCLGFGVSTADDVKKISAYADGVIIGSAFEKIIEANLSAKNLPEMLAAKVAEFKAATM